MFENKNSIHPLFKIPIYEIHERDSIRNENLKEAGFNLLIIWSHDVKVDRSKEIDKCLEFLGLNYEKNNTD